MRIADSPLARLYRISPADRPKLRIGLLLDTPRLLACMARVVDDIRLSNFAELCLIVYNGSASKPAEPQRPRSIAARLARLVRNKSARRQLLYYRYTLWDQAHAGITDDPLALCDYSTVLAGVPSMTVEPITHKFTHRFPDDAVAAIRSHEPDVLLRFGFNIIRGDILKAARYGVWSFHHGDNEYYRGGAPHFWELVERHPHTGVILQVLTEELDGGVVLAKGLFATEHGLSVAKNRYGPYWGTTHFVIQKLYELHRHGWDFVRSRMLPEAPYRGRRKLYRMPDNWEMTKWLSRELAGKVTTAVLHPLQSRTRLHWRIGIRLSKTPLFEEGTGALASFRWCEAPAGRSYADPILFEREGRRWIFVEDYEYGRKQACISVGEISEKGDVGVLTPCLTRPYHLSYPLVFSHEGEIFMLPETGSHGCVELYRAKRFPSEWTLEKVLLPLRAVDTTPLYHGGQWWFFTTITEPPGCSAFGQLFSAKTLTGDWVLHPASPISFSAADARSAGPILRLGGRLLRPTQSACPTYGASFSVHEITQLDGERYEQKTIATIDPAGLLQLKGTHTYTRAGDMEAIDGCWAVKK